MFPVLATECLLPSNGLNVCRTFDAVSIPGAKRFMVVQAGYGYGFLKMAT